MSANRRRASASAIRFDAPCHAADERAILRLPQPVSSALPSRGQVAVRATVNGHAFDTVLEPDGEFGHWMSVDKDVQEAAQLSAGDAATVEISPLSEWPEPAVPDDLQLALAAAPPKIQAVWATITPMARWEWVRWVNATRNPETRRRRVEVSISKMNSGKRRPCCFNLASCTDPDLSRNGKLVL